MREASQQLAIWRRRRSTTLTQTRTAIRLAVEAKLPVEIDRPAAKLPNLREMAAELGREERNFVYRIASQYAHASHVGTGVYRRNLGVDAELGDFTTADQWLTPLSLSWFALKAPTSRLLTCAGGDALAFESELPSLGFSDALEALSRDQGGSS